MPALFPSLMYVSAAAVSVAAAAAAAVVPASAAPCAGAVVHPDHHDGNDHDDPEGLIVGKESAAIAAGIAGITG